MKKISLKYAMAVGGAGLFASALSHAAPVDLSTWTDEGGSSNWVVQPGNDAVLQTVNGAPTVFFNPLATTSQGFALNGKIKGNPDGDNDFIGFVLGYNTGEIASNAADFLLVDWKQGDQGVAKDGLSISRVTNALDDDDFWGHVGGVQELERASTLGSTGWVDGVDYDFNIVFTSALVEVKVNNILELSLTAAEAGLASFGDGAFGFYNYSQANVLYSAITELNCINTPTLPECQVTNPPEPTPEPGTLALFGAGLLALVKRRRRVTPV